MAFAQKNVLGEKEAAKVLVPLLYVTNKPETIPFNDLPEEYFIKANHASGWYVLAGSIEEHKKYTIFYNGNTTALNDCKKTRNEIIANCRNWLSLPYSFHAYEWAYQKIKRKIVIEKLLRDINGKMPADYKFIVFHGKCQLIQVVDDKYLNMKKAWYTPEWKFLTFIGHAKQNVHMKRPKNLKSMIAFAELLGKPFDFIRVDLYSVDNHIYFGELTSYPLSGRIPFNPASYDFELGSKWKIIPGYWKSASLTD